MHDNLRWPIGVCAGASLLMIAAALARWGAAEVRASIGEVSFLTLAGAVWLFVGTKMMTWLGLSFRDDVVERGNVAALIALCGALIALAALYAGGSIGEGPSYSNNVFSVGLGAAGWLALWILLEMGAGVSASIAEERDVASGVRMGGFLLAEGLLLGRAIAGDWHSEAATMLDFIHDGWPAAVVCVMAIFIERFARPDRRRLFPPWPKYGLPPALFYLALAAAWLWHLGAWEGMR